MLKIPALILKRLYTFSTLTNRKGAVSFSLKNRLSNASLTGFRELSIDGQKIDPAKIILEFDEERVPVTAVDAERTIDFPLARIVEIVVEHEPLAIGPHEIAIAFDTAPFGKIAFKVSDSISDEPKERVKVPFDRTDDYADRAIEARQKFARDFASTTFEHIDKYSFDPHLLQGNIENFTGVAQIPLGLAGPLTVDGEHAQGDFLIPLATTEGTLVASYNRGIKALNLSGGVKTTVHGDCMQRAPVFVLESAREARDFAHWVRDHFDDIKREAEATSSVAKLIDIDKYTSNRFVFLRFNYTTGDAAGQNMVGRATFAACSWILDHISHVKRFYLESNFATDKKASQVNIMRTRGKRVTAEAVVPRDVLQQHMRVDPEQLHYHAGVSNVGSFLSGANNNGAHSPNAITAMFIATGQDVANVSESSAGVVYTEVTDDKDLYMSITIPSLIVATYGGGTGLPTQRECLEILGCFGRDKVHKFAEIVAGVVLAGELSLASAISSLDWVSSHEQYGRNR